MTLAVISRRCLAEEGVPGPGTFEISVLREPDTGGQGLVAVDLSSGRACTVLEEDKHSLSNPTWSADGRCLAVELYDGTDNELYLCYPATETSRRLLTSDQMAYPCPSGDEYSIASFACLSPDGRHVAYCRQKANREDRRVSCTNLCTVDVASGKVKRLTNIREGWALEPTWSPDSQRIAYVEHKWRAGSSSRLVVTNLGGEPLASFSDGSHIESPTWSPCGRFIVYAAQSEIDPDLFPEYWTPSRRSLHVLRVSDMQASRLPVDEYDAFKPRWLGTGRHLVYLARASEEDTYEPLARLLEVGVE